MRLSLTKCKNWWLGPPRDPLDPNIRKHIALIAFLAWIGLGADGLSSSCYGPEEAFLALGSHTPLGLYLAIATAFTVFVISIAYNQVIELFPSGGGGYKVATTLLGTYAGLISGAALIVDYILTIVTSVASSMDALFSLLPLYAQHFKFLSEVLIILLLISLNLRGMKESIKFLMPIFLGFVITHFALIIYGVASHKSGIVPVLHNTLQETTHLASSMGWLFVIALFLRAYSLGSGTYTGIEAVSNNINTLVEPRISTGKWTMFYMAISLSFTAGGIILLYLLWGATPQPGVTLNAVTFHAILGDSLTGESILLITLLLEAGLLLVAANTGFLGGPQVLANMALDAWLPNRFRHLSNRLVIQNGIILFGIAALAILYWSHGHVATLVILYSINVFITFSLSLLGLSVYWWHHRQQRRNAKWRLCLSFFGFCITASILAITLFSKFAAGGWLTLTITATLIGICLWIKRHYQKVAAKLDVVEKIFATVPIKEKENPLPLQMGEPTAVFLVGKSRGTAMHTLLAAQRMFPDHFKNYIFVSVGVVDVASFMGKRSLQMMQRNVEKNLKYFVDFCHYHNLAATSYCDYGTDPIDLLTELCKKVHEEFPNSVFFTSKLIFDNDNWLTRLLHNETSITMQHRLHPLGMQSIILPMKL